ncbi:MAG: DUF1801 domain-containing protein [Flavobacteriales bacterium]|nr:DUF1801 domain-containing protein [Flavobacteriales bacterium]
MGIQPVNFHSVEDFLSFIPDQEREIVERLRQVVFDCIPQVREKLAYNVPFYYGRRRICFIWPASVPWGAVPLNGVQLGFCSGHLMRDELNWLEHGNRKQVYIKTFKKVDEIDTEMVRAYLFEAVRVDDDK